MQRFISPIGFSSNLVTRPIIANGLSAGDRVDIIRPEQPDGSGDDRTQNAIDNIRSTLSGVVSHVELEVILISNFAFEAVVDRCSQAIMDGPSPVICFGAGATDIQLPLTVATIIHRDHITATMLYSDLQSTSREIDLPSMKTNVPGRTVETFEAIGVAKTDSGVSLATLAEATDVARTTVGRHVQALEQRGLVESKTRQKQKTVRMTTFGRLLFRNIVAENSE